MTDNRTVKCSLCRYSWHKNCLPNFSDTDYEYALDEDNSWSCPLCLTDIFPFNGIEDNATFTQAIINPNNSAVDIDLLNSMLYDPFESNDNDSEFFFDDIDPDRNFLDEVRGRTMRNCKYFHTSQHMDNLLLRKLNQSASFLHLNIRSIPKNLDTFTTSLHSANMNIDLLAFTETWLKPSNADCFGITGYRHEFITRDDRMGEGCPCS